MRKQLLEFIHQYLSDEEVKFLAKGWTAVRLLGTLVFVICFVSCDDYIEYNGPRDPEKLVVLQNTLQPNRPPQIVLSHTYFFLDAKQYNRKMQYVPDATVKVRVNGGEWITLPYDDQKCMYRTNESNVVIATDDIIDMEASHDTYGTITATQRVPHYVDVSIPTYHFTKEGWVVMDVHVGAYQGDSTDVIAFSLPWGRISCSYMLADSLVRDTADLQFLYSQDPIFGLQDNTTTPHGYYYAGGEVEALFVPASALREPRTISIFADQYLLGDLFEYNDIQLDSLVLHVSVITRDRYLYQQSMAKATAGVVHSSYVREPSGIESDAMDIYDIVQDYINGMSSVLGGQEGTQVYTNVANGVGCFGAQATKYIDVVNQKILEY